MKPPTDDSLNLERSWYDQEDENSSSINYASTFSTNGLIINEDFISYENKKKFIFKKNNKDAKALPPSFLKPAKLRRMQYERDNDRWENNRLARSGITENVEESFIEEQEEQVHLVYHECKPPPFISKYDDESVISTSTTTYSMDPVLPLKDPTSDIAQMSRKGSRLITELRESKNRSKEMKVLEGAGTTLGNIRGVLDEDDSDSDSDFDSSDSADSDFADSADSNSNFNSADSNSNSSSLKRESNRKQTLREQRQQLPSFKCKNDLLRLIRSNQVTIVVGETGSGKSTQLTQYLLEDGYCPVGSGLMVACTQPRRVAAMSVAKRVADEVGCSLGDEVGYSIRFEDCTSAKTRIKYMTDGILLREALKDPELNRYSVIVIDEAHERSLQTDILLGLLKDLVRKRRDLKIIVTSATMNANKFQRYFTSSGFDDDLLSIFTIPGRTFPVQVLYTRQTPTDWVEAAVKQVISIHVSQGPGDILVFMTGQEDIETCCSAIRERLCLLIQEAKTQGSEKVRRLRKLSILPIYSQLPADLQAKIFAPNLRHRKCIVSTNIAETSLTLDGVKYVIDSGVGKVKVYNPKMGMDALQVFPISQAAANQRSGRAGRVGPGTCWRMYSEQTFNNDLLSSNVPEIQRSNLCNVVLLLKNLGIKDITTFPFLDPPPLLTLLGSMHQLWVLGAIDGSGGGDANDGQLTSIGKQMVEFPLDPPLARMILAAAYGYGDYPFVCCTEEILTIVSMLSVPGDLFMKVGKHDSGTNGSDSTSETRMQASDAARERFAVPESDHLTLLNIYQQWNSSGRKQWWCKKNWIFSRSLERASEVREQLVFICKQQKIPLRSCTTTTSLDPRASWDPVRRAIAASYVHKVAKFKGIGEYFNMRTGMPCKLHPTSSLYGLGYTPEYVVYHEQLLLNRSSSDKKPNGGGGGGNDSKKMGEFAAKTETQSYMQCVTAVEPDWLAQAAPLFFSIRMTSSLTKRTEIINYSVKDKQNGNNGFCADLDRHHIDDCNDDGGLVENSPNSTLTPRTKEPRIVETVIEEVTGHGDGDDDEGPVVIRRKIR